MPYYQYFKTREYPHRFIDLNGKVEDCSHFTKNDFTIDKDGVLFVLWICVVMVLTRVAKGRMKFKCPKIQSQNGCISTVPAKLHMF